MIARLAQGATVLALVAVIGVAACDGQDDSPGKPCSPEMVAVFPLTVGRVDSALVATADTVLRWLPQFDVHRIEVNEDSIVRSWADSLAAKTHGRTGEALVAILTRPGNLNPPLLNAAGVAWIELGLPKAPIEALLLSDRLDDRRRFALFWILREFEAPPDRPSPWRRDRPPRPVPQLGFARHAFVCQLALHIISSEGPPGRETAGLFLAALGAVEDEAREGSRQARWFLDDSVLRTARRRLADMASAGLNP
jgi:hypothetical protein